MKAHSNQKLATGGTNMFKFIRWVVRNLVISAAEAALRKNQKEFEMIARHVSAGSPKGWFDGICREATLEVAERYGILKRH